MALTDAPARWTRAPSACWRRSLGATYVMGARDVTELGGPAAILWELLGDGVTTSEAIDHLADAHGVAPESIATEITDVLDRLEREHLLDVASPLRPGRATRFDVPAGERPSDDPAAAIAGYGLPGCSLALPDPTIAGAETIVDTIRRERLSGLAVAAVHDGRLVLPRDARARLADAHRDAMITCLRLERMMVDTVGLLESGGVTPLVIKGPAVAHVQFADPAQRPFGDIDLLVPAEQLGRAYALLAAAGAQRRYPEPRPGFDQRFGKGAAFVMPDGLELDVHRTFAAGPFGLTVDTAEAVTTPRTFEVGGRTLHTVAEHIALVALSMHAVLGNRVPRLLNLRDVAQTASGIADPSAAIDVARRWEVDSALALAVEAAADRFALPADELVEWARTHRAPARQRRALAAYQRPDRSYARQAMAALPALRTTSDRAAYLRAMLFPDRSYVSGRDGSHRRRWLRMARVLARRERRAL